MKSELDGGDAKADMQGKEFEFGAEMPEVEEAAEGADEPSETVDEAGAVEITDVVDDEAADAAEKPGTLEITQEELEPKKAPKKPKMAKLRKTLGSKNLLWGMIGAVLTVLLLGGGVLTGLMLGKTEEKKEPEGGNEIVAVSGEVDGGGGGVLVDAIKVPENDKLTLAFLKLHNGRENSCYSPLSVRYALEMLSAGAEGETKAQIDALLGGMTATRYENVAGHLSIANSLWVSETYSEKLQKSYAELLRDQFAASVHIDNFQTAANINAWVNDNSMELIKDPLSDQDVQGLNAALVNVLAIDMNWVRQFERDMTFGGFFDFDRLADVPEGELNQDKYKYTTMHRWGGKDVYYNLAADATVLAMDLKEYGGTQLQFVAVMPKDLESYVEKVTLEDINKLFSGLRVAIPQNDTYAFSFNAYIPKFGITGGIENLIADLKELGVTKAFDAGEAELMKMLDVEDFAIDAATHKTKFDFSEEGIRAAAVTLLGGKGMAGGPAPIPSSSSIVVSINKPFMYLVRDKKTGEVWFAGTVYDPNRWEEEKADYQ